jgi:hypothetical protein
VQNYIEINKYAEDLVYDTLPFAITCVSNFSVYEEYKAAMPKLKMLKQLLPDNHQETRLAVVGSFSLKHKVFYRVSIMGEYFWLLKKELN